MTRGAIEEVPIGPFVGGLNTHADPSAIADNELVVCDNFEPDLDTGSLKSRPPITTNSTDMPLKTTGDMRLLGFYVNVDGAAYLIGTNGLDSTYYLSGGAWQLITNTIAATNMAQFDGKAWLLAPVGSTNPGGYWSPTTNFIPQPNMPKGDVIVAHKLRLWVSAGANAQANGTRLYNSDPIGTTSLWPVSPNFTDIGGGDGQNIINIIVLYNNLLIFRTNSIYTFVFGSDPATGQVNLLQSNVGLVHRDALAMYENQIYFIYADRAYVFMNSRAIQINQKVSFVTGVTAGIYQPYAVSVFNRRVIFSYWGKNYVFHVLNQTWTTWSSTAWGPIGRVIALPPTVGAPQAYAHQSAVAPSGSSRSAPTLHITDDITTASEQFTCRVQTKIYSYQLADARKRLFSGGIDGIFRGSVTATAVPIIYIKQLNWKQIRDNGLTWADLRQSLWNGLSSDRITVTSVVAADSTTAQRKFIKLWDSLFFRQIYFTCSFDCDGSTTTAPVRLFMFTTRVLPKKRVSQSVN